MKNTPIHILSRQEGFSLVEALVALAILTVGLLAIGLMQIGAMKANTNAQSRTDGVAVAQSTLDVLRTLPMGDPLLTDNGNVLDAGISIGGADPVPANADHSGAELYGNDTITGPSGQDYTIFWNVTDNDIDADGDTDTKTLRLFVYWTDQRFGLNRTIVTSAVGGLYL